MKNISWILNGDFPIILKRFEEKIARKYGLGSFGAGLVVIVVLGLH
jgi:hypothetical protein